MKQCTSERIQWRMSKGLFCLCLLFFLGACQEDETYRMSGWVEGNHYPILSEVSGRIVGVLKQEGDKILKDEVFAQIDTTVYKHTVEQLASVAEAKRFKLEDLIKGTRTAELKAAKVRLDQAVSGIATANKTLEVAQLNYAYAMDRYTSTQDAYATLKVTEEELKDARYRLDLATKSVEEAKEKVHNASTQRDLARANYDLALEGASDENIQMARADWNAAVSQWDAAKGMLEKYTLRSPVDGVLESKTMLLGELATSGSTLGVVLNPEELYVKLYVPQKYLDKIALGQTISLVCYANKAVSLKGKVSYISEVAEFTPRNIETDEAKAATMVMIKVDIQSKDAGIKPGMTVETFLSLK